MTAGDYSAFVVTPDQMEDVKILGVDDVGDCVEIIGWHEDTKVIYLYHMNEFDWGRLTYSTLGLLAETSKNPEDKDLIEDGVKSRQPTSTINITHYLAYLNT